MDNKIIEKNWRNQYNVLVPQADSMGAIAVIRSLGSHGYNVFSASSNPKALGCRSNFSSTAVCCPEYDNNYLDWLRKYIKENNIQAIVPSEAFYLVIKDCFDEFSYLLPISSPKDVIYQCLCKVDVFDAFLSSGDKRLTDNISNTQVVTSAEEVDWPVTANWNYPLFIKGDGFYAHSGDDARIIKAETEQDAKKAVIEVFQSYDKAIVQDCSEGVKATVNLIFQDGELLAESMAVATHENPHTGGLTSLRHSWWQQEMYEDAIIRMKFLKWNGPAMVEYKWHEATNTFDFIELNSRYWAALNLDILAGIHFPCIHLDYFFEKLKPKKSIRLVEDIEVRNALPADFGYMLSSLKDVNITKFKKAAIVIEFLLLFLNPKIKADLLYPNDRKLYFINLWAFTKEFTSSCLKRLK
jgi:predicted ATP-grasp superfamily ATP-dependent carboligase